MVQSMKRSVLFRLLLLALLLVLVILSVANGVQDFSLWRLLKGDSADMNLAIISRLPRTISIVVTGAGLAMAGLIMQTVTGNKYVAPTTAGTMEWCRFGVLIAILFQAKAPALVKVTVAFVISLAGTMVFMALLVRLKLKDAYMVPLIGMMLGSVVSAVTTFISYQYDLVQNISSWLQGNFALIVKGRYEILYLGVPLLIVTYIYAGKFTIAGMGESFTASLGLNHRLIITTGMVIVAMITSLIVVTIGNIPFVGLIIPNIVSMIRGDNLKGSLPDTVLLGAVFLLICDLGSRIVIAPYEINVSVIASVAGSLFFIIMLLGRKRV